MKFRKILLYISLTSFLLLFTPTLVSALDNEQSFDSLETFEEYADEIYSALDSETKEILSSFGVDEIDLDGVFELSFSKVLNSFLDIFKSSVRDMLPIFMKMTAMLILMSVSSGLRKGQSRENDNVSFIFSLTVTVMSASFLSNTLKSAVSAFNLTGKLLLTLAPIITALLSVSGNVTASMLYNSVTVAIAQIISAIASEFLVPFIGIYFSFVISLDLSDGVKGDRPINWINKLLTGAVTAMSTAFTLILSIKNVLAKEIDSVLYKSGKYVISGFVPIVGSNISAILSSVVGALEMLKSTVAVFALICVAAVNLPVIVRLFVCYILLNALALIADFFSVQSCASVIRGFAGGVKLMNAVVFFELVLVIISLGLTAAIKGAM